MAEHWHHWVLYEAASTTPMVICMICGEVRRGNG